MLTDTDTDQIVRDTGAHQERTGESGEGCSDDGQNLSQGVRRCGGQPGYGAIVEEVEDATMSDLAHGTDQEGKTYTPAIVMAMTLVSFD